MPNGSQQFTFAATTMPADIASAFNWMGIHLGWHAQTHGLEFVEVVSTGSGPDDFISIEQSVSIGRTLIACTEPDIATCSDYAIAYSIPGPAGDLNGDGAVGVADLLLLLAAWGPCAADVPCPADFDGDGVVGVQDLLILLNHWG